MGGTGVIMGAPDLPAVDEELLRALPPIVRAVVRALGFGRARKFLADHGGVSVHIPKIKERALGLEPDELERLRLCLAIHIDANGRVDLPKADKLFQLVRNAQIRHDRRYTSLRVLARQNHLTSRHIQNICREGDDEQLNLF